MNVTGKPGNAAVALAVNTFIALDNAANDFFSPLVNAMGVRPSYMQNTPTNNELTGQVAEAGVFVGTMLIGPGGEAQGASKLWSKGKAASGVRNAFEHWMRHGKEFSNLQNAKQYVEAARDFVTNPPTGTLSKLRANGDTVLYNPSTNTFAVKTVDGVPRTMFKPTNGMTYFNAQ